METLFEPIKIYRTVHFDSPATDPHGFMEPQIDAFFTQISIKSD